MLNQDEKSIQEFATNRMNQALDNEDFLIVWGACQWKMNKNSRQAVKDRFPNAPKPSASDKEWRKFMLETFDGLERKLNEAEAIRKAMQEESDKEWKIKELERECCKQRLPVTLDGATKVYENTLEFVKDFIRRDFKFEKEPRGIISIVYPDGERVYNRLRRKDINSALKLLEIINN